MKVPQISVIVPVYQAEAYIRRCLDSIVNQTFQDWECILVDDGSKDNSGTICDNYAVRDSRFRVIHQANRGVSYNPQNEMFAHFQTKRPNPQNETSSQLPAKSSFLSLT